MWLVFLPYIDFVKCMPFKLDRQTVCKHSAYFKWLYFIIGCLYLAYMFLIRYHKYALLIKYLSANLGFLLIYLNMLLTFLIST